MKKIIIAIDGYSSCGKSTLAKDLAHQLGYIYVDTGAMYRAVTLYTLQNGFWKDEHTPDINAIEKEIKNIHISFLLNKSTGLPEVYLNGINVEKEIRTMKISNKVSPISAIGLVREALTAQQKNVGRQGGIVMDGRDIGTVVFPNAELKIFLTASPEIRAKRRYEELKAKGETNISMQEVLNNLQERDYIDSHREVSPLRKADDAIVLDNSEMNLQQQLQWALTQAERIIHEKSVDE